VRRAVLVDSARPFRPHHSAAPSTAASARQAQLPARGRGQGRPDRERGPRQHFPA